MADGRVLATRGGRCHPTERQDAASGPTPAGEQPVMSLCPLRIRREHLRGLCGRPLWAEPTEGFDRSIGWSGSAKALDDWRDQYHGHGRQILRTTSISLGISSRDRSRVRDGLRSNLIAPSSTDSKPWASTIKKRPPDATLRGGVHLDHTKLVLHCC